MSFNSTFEIRKPVLSAGGPRYTQFGCKAMKVDGGMQKRKAFR